MRYWWVNQNQTYKTEVPGGFLWSPKTRADGARNQFYENMREVSPGNIIFSFSDTKIKAIGLALKSAETSPKPDFGSSGANWSQEGWLVSVAFKELSNQIRPKDHIEKIRSLLPPKYSPLQASGDGLQSVYLAEVPEPLANVLQELIGSEFNETLLMLNGSTDLSESKGDEEEQAIQGRTDIGPTTKTQLVKSRRGQGLFKANVRLNEKGCRVTGVTDPTHLRASHIKPWSESNDEEKLNGCNGILLSPHLDHLFDRGYISFSDSGELMISSRLDAEILARWAIHPTTNVGSFNVEQARFLQYHRDKIFKP
jgi:hypothetical protein